MPQFSCRHGIDSYGIDYINLDVLLVLFVQQLIEFNNK